MNICVVKTVFEKMAEIYNDQLLGSFHQKLFDLSENVRNRRSDVIVLYLNFVRDLFTVLQPKVRPQIQITNAVSQLLVNVTVLSVGKLL